jgi:hypothetical protein
MAWNKRITTLEGANTFWNRYGWVINELGRTQYEANPLPSVSFPHVNAPLVADSLSEIMFKIGDTMMTPQPLYTEEPAPNPLVSTR